MAEKNSQDLLVIGTGLPRTGTKSLQLAFQTLGFAPCHHFGSDLANEPFPYRNGKLWRAACVTTDKHQRQAILRQIYESGGYKSATDFPMSSFLEDLVEMYLDAKFIHCERSSPEFWRKSFNETIGRLEPRLSSAVAFLLPAYTLSLRHVLSGLNMRAKRLGGGLFRPLDDIDLYHAHNEHVRRVVPKSRLLVFDAKQGYQPLCEFLGVPVPKDENGEEVAYPYVNDRQEITKVINGIFAVCRIIGVAVVGSFLVVKSGLLHRLI